MVGFSAESILWFDPDTTQGFDPVQQRFLQDLTPQGIGNNGNLNQIRARAFETVEGKKKLMPLLKVFALVVSLNDICQT